ncbi:uncharacterized protein C8Q71DRAFT_775912 [Rhodofomes roseus]|uniref:Uncharacterized protein n=1 Tax=Rhodofomes roseus TaxID=34475 RepID=A0ABQ8K821_9APHY|nr:uncharacterized protein C8Q71DRAFT_775912 [Rhodofomes roseus]KAH9832995.1 hypothetical protein C8Q71DRAFT_775912 [Rhodofomes roseus]
MVRQQTTLIQKFSPHASQFQKVASARYAKAPQKSPLAAVYPSARNVRTALGAANTNRFLKSRSKLAAIKEEPLEEEEEDQSAYTHRHDLHREFDALERDEDLAYRKHRRDEDDSMDWDDESTLVAMLQKTPAVDEQEEVAALANKLKVPMAAQGAAIRQYLGETLLPVIARVKEVHALLEGKIDLAFGAGVMTFDEVCKKVENMAIRDEDELKTAYTDCQRNMEDILEQLQEAYARRDGLWVNLQQDVDQCAERAKGALENLPADVERVIAALEKKSKELDKDGSAASKQKMLKGLLEKL